MGMDLEPIRPSKDAPKGDNGFYQWNRYNWTGWSWLVEKLDEWGVDISEFADMNDGDEISEATCRAVADAIERP